MCWFSMCHELNTYRRGQHLYCSYVARKQNYIFHFRVRQQFSTAVYICLFCCNGNTCTCTHACPHAGIYTHTHGAYTFAHTHTHTHTHTCTHARTHARARTHTHTHTHKSRTHTHTRSHICLQYIGLPTSLSLHTAFSSAGVETFLWIDDCNQTLGSNSWDMVFSSVFSDIVDKCYLCLYLVACFSLNNLDFSAHIKWKSAQMK